ncbi:hypothetical protein PAEVO_13500 [Paenibacillus sp. GM2FR]|nr:hypothetical protein PAEVO_13500 [Paenibacillus sp. GM2FR]
MYYFDTSTKDEQGEFPVMLYVLMNDLVEAYAHANRALNDKI